MKTSLLFESGSNSLTDEALYVESIASASYKDFIANSFYLREKFEESLEDYFEILKNLWLEETKLSSNVFITLSHPAYLRIIKLGNDILPYILDDLQQNKNHWFFALNKISGENPVKVEHVGNIDLMANDWINWGKAKNMIA